MNRVVVTGIGILSPLGNDKAAVAEGLRNGRSGIRRMAEWQKIKGLQSFVGGEVTGFDPQRIPRPARRTMGKLAIMATIASDDAVRDAGLAPEYLRSGRAGLSIGSTTGSPQSMSESFSDLALKGGIEGQMGTSFMKVMGHSAAANAAVHLGITGCVYSPTAACASSAQAIGLGYDLIRHGQQEVMICGGAEELHATTAGTFDIVHAASRAYNESPDKTPRPFDAARDGLAVSEGAAIMVLEDRERALSRNACIYAEILGFATCCDGAHIAMPSGEGMLRCMRSSLISAGLEPGDIDYINAHATGTQIGDATESQGIKEIFGGLVPVSSSKGHVGHTIGACGSMEAIFSILMMREGFLAPTLNLEHISEDCSGINHLQQTVTVQAGKILSNSFAFGGINASLILGNTGR
ncbi:MAG TPA: beta-ketoacyl synthase [Elusimicrobia bacterium]|nr:beta-ketoacyl synthase [Elusimicrobiota bacterium]